MFWRKLKQNNEKEGRGKAAFHSGEKEGSSLKKIQVENLGEAAANHAEMESLARDKSKCKSPKLQMSYLPGAISELENMSGGRLSQADKDLSECLHNDLKGKESTTTYLWPTRLTWGIQVS